MKNTSFRFGEVIKLLEKKSLDEETLLAIENFLHLHIKNLSPHSYEDKGFSFYLLIKTLLLKNPLLETKEIIIYFTQCKENFRMKRHQVLKEASASKEKQLHALAFLKTVRKYFQILEKEFDRLHFRDLSKIAYITHMYYQERIFRQEKKYLAFTGYSLWSMMSQYGTNFIRWGVTNIVFLFFFSILFFLNGERELVAFNAENELLFSPITTEEIAGYTKHPMLFSYSPQNINPANYMYFTVVSITTLGYGDIVPITVSEKILTGFVVLFGYSMLGIFISLIGKKL
jgi:hypothetical protein